MIFLQALALFNSITFLYKYGSIVAAVIPKVLVVGKLEMPSSNGGQSIYDTAQQNYYKQIISTRVAVIPRQPISVKTLTDAPTA